LTIWPCSGVVMPVTYSHYAIDIMYTCANDTEKYDLDVKGPLDHLALLWSSYASDL